MLKGLVYFNLLTPPNFNVFIANNFEGTLHLELYAWMFPTTTSL